MGIDLRFIPQLSLHEIIQNNINKFSNEQKMQLLKSEKQNEEESENEDEKQQEQDIFEESSPDESEANDENLIDEEFEIDEEDDE